MKIKGLVVGLGQIGMGYDYNNVSTGFITSHAKALQEHPDFELVGGVDPAPEQRERFVKKYGKPAYKSLETALQECSPELAIVATPTKEHANTFGQVLECASVRLILCEKPIALNSEDAEMMVTAADSKNITVAVNYIRRYEPGARILTQRINSGELGFPLKACVWYSKGIYNNGSHFLNFLSAMFGNVQQIEVLSKGRLWDNADPEVDVKVHFERGDAYFLAAREECFSYCEMEIIGPLGKVRYSKSGCNIDWWSIMPDPDFPEYKILQDTPESIPAEMNRYQYHVLQNISDFLSGRSELYCDGDSGIKTMRILDKIKEAWYG